jgi:hypothetical protein
MRSASSGHALTHTLQPVQSSYEPTPPPARSHPHHVRRTLRGPGSFSYGRGGRRGKWRERGAGSWHEWAARRARKTEFLPRTPAGGSACRPTPTPARAAWCMSAGAAPPPPGWSSPGTGGSPHADRRRRSSCTACTCAGSPPTRALPLNPKSGARCERSLLSDAGLTTVPGMRTECLPSHGNWLVCVMRPPSTWHEGCAKARDRRE